MFSKVQQSLAKFSKVQQSAAKFSKVQQKSKRHFSKTPGWLASEARCELVKSLHSKYSGRRVNIKAYMPISILVIAQLVERWTVEGTDIHRSLVPFRFARSFENRRRFSRVVDLDTFPEKASGSNPASRMPVPGGKVPGAELTRSERLIRWKCVFIRSNCPLPFAFGYYWLASNLGRLPFEWG
jgi:hypothetical protein